MRALAPKLNVSYSALNQSNQSAKWPHYIAAESIREVFDDCRESVFGQDGNNITKPILLQLHEQASIHSILNTHLTIVDMTVS
jgi:hypothetical protein